MIKRNMIAKKPFSLVRVGDGENIVLAQKGVWSIQKVLRTSWARKSRKTNKKGVKLPNIRLRNQMIRALRRASLVAIPHRHDNEIKADEKYLRPLTEKAFSRYKINPTHVCHTFINRHLPEKKEFWNMLRGKKVILISKWANQFNRYVEKNYPNHRDPHHTCTIFQLSTDEMDLEEGRTNKSRYCFSISRGKCCYSC